MLRLYTITYMHWIPYNNIAYISSKLEKMANRFIFDLGLQQYDISRGPHFFGISWIFRQRKFIFINPILIPQVQSNTIISPISLNRTNNNRTRLQETIIVSSIFQTGAGIVWWRVTVINTQVVTYDGRIYFITYPYVISQGVSVYRLGLARCTDNSYKCVDFIVMMYAVRITHRIYNRGLFNFTYLCLIDKRKAFSASCINTDFIIIVQTFGDSCVQFFFLYIIYKTSIILTHIHSLRFAKNNRWRTSKCYR